MKVSSLVLFSMLLGQLVFAADLSASGIYRATYSACNQVRAQDLSTLKGDRLQAGYFPSEEFTQLLNLIRSSSLRRTALELNVAPDQYGQYVLKHPEFSRALNDCYPNDPKMIEFFRASVTKADRAGKFVGIAALLAVFKGQSQIVSLIKSWSYGVYRTLMVGQSVALGTLGLSLLRSDTEQKQDTMSAEDFIEKLDEKIEAGHMKKPEQLASLKAQIDTEREKLRNCGQCSEATKLRRQLEALEALLKTLSEY